MQLSAEQQSAINEQKQHCPFCKMVRGDIQVQKVFEDEHFIAILDINPGATGHTLLVPKEHYPILPFMPQEVQAKLARHLAEMGAGLKRSMVTLSVESFIANGSVAGQQTSHFLVHLLPAEKQIMHLPSGETSETQRVRDLLRARFAPPKPQPSQNKDTLSEAIAKHPELRRMLLENPEELIANLSSAPDIAELFKGVDIRKLSEKLKEQETPEANALTDEQLTAFINAKEQLRELLVNDPSSLEEAAQHQPRLGKFFSGTSVSEVRERYLRGTL